MHRSKNICIDCIALCGGLIHRLSTNCRSWVRWHRRSGPREKEWRASGGGCVLSFHEKQRNDKGSVVFYFRVPERTVISLSKAFCGVKTHSK